jgi:hypothetical protein
VAKLLGVVSSCRLYSDYPSVALLTALTLCCRNTKGSGEDDALGEEIAEALGKAYYQNVMGSVSNGYPSCELTNFEKQFLAKRAIVCFELVIGYGTARGDVLRWDLLHFMIGKVCILSLHFVLLYSFCDIVGFDNLC